MTRFACVLEYATYIYTCRPREEMGLNSSFMCLLKIVFKQNLFPIIACCLQDVECRLDLRHVAVCSIDPPGCTDIDDALHWRLLDTGNYEVKQTTAVVYLVI